VDLIFVKAKKKGERRINYARFLDALGMIAIQKFGEMVRLLDWIGSETTIWLDVVLIIALSCATTAARTVRAAGAGGPHRAASVCHGVHRRQSGAAFTQRACYPLAMCLTDRTMASVQQVQAVWQKRAERDDGAGSGGDQQSPPPSPPKSSEHGKSAASRLFPGPSGSLDAPLMMPPPAPVDASSAAN
jgi:hypothetical protein